MRNLTHVIRSRLLIMSSQRNSSDSLVIVLLPVGILAAIVLSISRTLGADFLTTAMTLLKLIVLIAVVGGVHYFVRWNASITIALFCFFAWPTCWPLFDSIASGGKAANEIYDHHLTAWYVQRWFLWSVEVILVAILAYIIYFDE
jgi:hypothetical protein